MSGEDLPDDGFMKDIIVRVLRKLVSPIPWTDPSVSIVRSLDLKFTPVHGGFGYVV